MPVLLLVTLLAGCARLQAFRVVDAQSGQPVVGIRAERLEGGVRPTLIPFVLVNKLSPVEHQATDASGMVAFQGDGTQFAVNPALFYPGYGRAFVSRTWSGVKILYPEEHREVAVKPKDGVIEVPLQRRSWRGPSNAQTQDGQDGLKSGDAT